MRTASLVALLLLAAGCSGGDRVICCLRAPPRWLPAWSQSEAPALALDVADLGSTAPAARRRAWRTLRDASAGGLLVDISSEPAIRWCVAPATLTETVESVEHRAALLVERGDLDVALWELERVGSRSLLHDHVRALHDRVHAKGCPSPAYGEGVHVVPSERDGVLSISGLRGESSLWTREVGSAREPVPFSQTARGSRIFLAHIDRVIALDAETGAIAWCFQRKAWTDDPVRAWIAEEVTGYELRVSRDAVEIVRRSGLPTDRLDPRTGRLLD